MSTDFKATLVVIAVIGALALYTLHESGVWP
jgi:hypothetical protein